MKIRLARFSTFTVLQQILFATNFAFLNFLLLQGLAKRVTDPVAQTLSSASARNLFSTTYHSQYLQQHLTFAGDLNFLPLTSGLINDGG